MRIREVESAVARISRKAAGYSTLCYRRWLEGKKLRSFLFQFLILERTEILKKEISLIAIISLNELNNL